MGGRILRLRKITELGRTVYVMLYGLKLKKYVKIFKIFCGNVVELKSNFIKRS